MGCGDGGARGWGWGCGRGAPQRAAAPQLFGAQPIPTVPEQPPRPSRLSDVSLPQAGVQCAGRRLSPGGQAPLATAPPLLPRTQARTWRRSPRSSTRSRLARGEQPRAPGAPLSQLTLRCRRRPSWRPRWRTRCARGAGRARRCCVARRALTLQPPCNPPRPPCTLPCTPVPCTPAQPLHTPAHPIHPSARLWTRPAPTLHPPCTHPEPALHPPCTSACGSPQEWLLEVVQREAEHRAKDPLSREKGADVVAIRGVQEREAQRAKFEMANKAVRHAMAALDKQNFTLTLRGEAYAEKMLCDQAALERCPGSSPDTSCEQVSFAPTVAPTHARNLAPTLAPFSPLPSPGTTRRSSCLHSSYRTSPALRRRDTLEVPSWCRHSSLPWPVGAVCPGLLGLSLRAPGPRHGSGPRDEPLSRSGRHGSWL